MPLRQSVRLGLIVGALFLLSACATTRVATAPARPAPTSPPSSAAPIAPGYEETGDASWYGHPYHGRKAASGETYDMNQMTAAHRTLPFGTRVRVESLGDGSSVEVRINDRGPFKDDKRIIDLSYAAAKLLGVVGPGVIPVKLHVVSIPGYTNATARLAPAPATTTPPAPPSPPQAQASPPPPPRPVVAASDVPPATVAPAPVAAAPAAPTVAPVVPAVGQTPISPPAQAPPPIVTDTAMSKPETVARTDVAPRVETAAVARAPAPPMTPAPAPSPPAPAPSPPAPVMSAPPTSSAPAPAMTAPPAPTAPAQTVAAPAPTAPVRLATAPPAPAAPAPPTEGWSVQLGAYASEGSAVSLRDSLARSWPDARVLRAEVSGRTLWRVRVGNYASRRDADEAARRLSASGYRAMVVDSGRP